MSHCSQLGWRRSNVPTSLPCPYVCPWGDPLASSFLAWSLISSYTGADFLPVPSRPVCRRRLTQRSGIRRVAGSTSGLVPRAVPRGHVPARYVAGEAAPAPAHTCTRRGGEAGAPQPCSSSCTSQHQPGEGFGGFGSCRASRHIAAALGTGTELVSNWFCAWWLPSAGPQRIGFVSPHGCLWHKQGEQHRLGTGSHTGGRAAPCERTGLQTGAARSVPCPTPHRAQRAAPGWSRAEARFRLCSDRSALIYGAGARRTRSTSPPPPCLFLILFPGSLVSFSADLSNAPTILRVPRCLESSQLEFAILGPKN